VSGLDDGWASSPLKTFIAKANDSIYGLSGAVAGSRG